METSEPEVGQRTCVFCGGAPLTLEHVLPRWLEKVLLDVSPSDDGYDNAYEWVSISERSEPRLLSVRKPEMTFKGVCTTCNSGWMASLEGAVQPALDALVRGQQIALSLDTQVTLAAWACKTAVLVEASVKGGVFGAAETQPLLERVQPPSSLQVRIAHRSNGFAEPFQVLQTVIGAAPYGTTGKENDGDLEANAFLCTMAFGAVAIETWGGPGMVNPTRLQVGGRFPVSIWPPTSAGVRWPPATRPLESREELRMFHEEVLDRLLNPEFERPDPKRHLPREA